MRIIQTLVLLFAFSVPPVLAASNPDPLLEGINQVIADLNNRSTKVFIDTLDLQRILHTAFSGLSLSERDKASFTKGFMSKREEIGKQIVERMPPHGYIKLVRYASNKDVGKALVRIDFGENGYGYMDFHLARINGKPRIVDWYDYAFGQKYSESASQLIVMTAGSAGMIQQLFKNFTGKQQLIDYVLAIVRLNREQKFIEAYELYQQADAAVKKEKILLLMFVKMANLSNNMEFYQTVLQDVAAYHGKDPAMGFVLLDYFFLKGDYDRAIQIMDNLMQSMGKEDEALLSMKANAFYSANKMPEAIAAASGALQREPTLEIPYWVLLRSYAKTKDYAHGVKLAEQMEKQFGYSLTEQTLSGETDLVGFIKSREFNAWRKTRSSR